MDAKFCVGARKEKCIMRYEQVCYCVLLNTSKDKAGKLKTIGNRGK
jgi:hypothetical protein